MRLEQLAVTSEEFDSTTAVTVDQLERAIAKLTESLHNSALDRFAATGEHDRMGRQR